LLRILCEKLQFTLGHFEQGFSFGEGEGY